jgi:hypothetical protein
MTGPFTPPEIFAAAAGYADGVAEPELQQGTYLRLLPSPAVGFPLAPFGIWRAQPREIDVKIAWTDAYGNVVNADLGAHDGELHGYLVPFGDKRIVAVGLWSTLEPTEFALLDGIDPQSSRVLVERSSEPWILAAPNVSHIRVRGRGFIEAVRAFALSEVDLLEQIGGEKPSLLGLPLEGTRPWYAGGQGRDEGLIRVKRGAPLQLGPPDRPDGPFDSIDPIEDVDRVAALADELERQLHETLRDPGQPPWLYRDPAETAAGVTPPQRTSFSAEAGLLLQALDPGLGRFLGLMTTLDVEFGEVPDAWLAAGIFALDPKRRLPDGRSFAAAFETSSRMSERLEERLMGEVPELSELVDAHRERGLLVRTLMTVAAAPPLPNRPARPAVSPGSSQWLLDDPLPSESFRQQLLVQDAPLAPLVAFARKDDEGWRSLHKLLELPSGARRAKALLLGSDGAGGGILADAPVPERSEALRYRVRLGDLFGRYGEETEQEATPPPHPPPPRPTPQTEIVRSAPSGEGLESSGSLIVRVPPPPLRDAVPGSRPIVAVEADLEGDASETSPEAPVTEFSFALPSLLPGGEARLPLTVRFRDDRDMESALAEESVHVADPRPPKPLRTGVGIVWTSRPGPAEEVELRLIWPARPGERYRVYLADAQSLGIETAGRTRAEIAEAASQLGAIDMRERFRLLTDPPLAADPSSGRVVLDARLPRSLQTLQLIRVVPISAGNVEAPFQQCGLVPVAVPSDRRPPPPRLAVQVDASSGRGSVRVEAPGLNREELLHAEPGHFTDPPASTARAPEYRLRRSVGKLVDSVYARELRRDSLERTQVDGHEVFVAEHEDGGDQGLEPYVRYAYWAEVRMPPERRVPIGVAEIPAPDDISATQPAQLADVPGLFSPPSAHAYAMRVLAAVPMLAPGQVHARLVTDVAAGVRLVLSIGNAPETHASAIDNYRLRVWLRQPGEPIAKLTPDGALPVVQGSLEWSSEPFSQADPASGVGLLLALVDPLGRQGRILELETVL